MYQHMIETEIARMAEEELHDRIESSSNIDGTWMRKGICEKDLFVGFVQLHHDKSVTSLRSTGVSAYPTPVNLMDVSYHEWKKTNF